MGKLIKYEFRKQLTSKVVVAILTAILQVVCFAGLIFNNEGWWAFGLILMMPLFIIALGYFSFEMIITYSNDLKTKQSYMLFLTPRNMFQIVGAKMITTVLQIVVAGAAFAAIFIGNIALVLAKNDRLKEFFDVMKQFIEIFTGIQVVMSDVIYIIAVVLVSWLELILLAMFAITLSTTLFANKRYKGFISFTIYFVLEILIGKMASRISGGLDDVAALVSSSEGWAYIGVYTVVMVLCFLGTSWLLEKKVSV